MTGERKPTEKSSKQRRVTFCHEMWYHFAQGMLYLSMKICFRMRYRGARHVPKTGPVLLVSNHQSFLDPPLVGCGFYRRMNFLARKTLFKFKPFGWLIDTLDAIPLDKQGIGFQGIKETLRRLKNGEGVVIFPEGARCFDGEIGQFTSGYVTLAMRSNATIVPVAIAGAFEVFPRTRKFPSFFKKPIRIEYGEPITPEFYKNKTEEEIHQLVEGKIREIYQRIR